MTASPRLASFFAACLLSSVTALAGPTSAPELPVQLHLTHLSADKWRADYVLSEPVASIDLGNKIGVFRQTAWHVLTPGIRLTQQGDNEQLSAEDNKTFSAFSIEVDLYLPFAQKEYTQFDRFSDGGTDVYMNFFAGDAKQGTQTRPLHLRLQLTGLPGELVLAPDDSNPERLSYAYFGPAKPVKAGIVTQIIDPATPAWLAEVLQTTTSKIANYYDRAFARKLSYAPLLMVSIGNTERSGISIKGGAVGSQVVYRLEGRDVLKDTPKARAMFSQVVSHEMAHVWQTDVQRGGIGDDEPWIHEGGAEAIAVEGMRRSGLFTEEQANEYAANALQECAKLQDSVASYRGIYACGFKRFGDMHMDIFKLWKAMMVETESSGKPYSSAMINALREKGVEGGASGQ